MYKLKLQQALLFLLLGGLLFSCNNPEEISNEDDISQEVTELLEEDFSQAKQVFYSLPSPIETAMLIKRAGANYDESLLNKISNIPNYTTTLSKAINLGIYGADLSFVSMFNQSQACVKYLSATKKLANALGILHAVDNSYITRMENNINNKDSLMYIISETFMNSNSFLKENQRPELAAIILAGGWLEGLYIATEITKNTEDKTELKTRIIDQRLPLETLLGLFSKYDKDKNIEMIKKDFEQIQSIYNDIEISTSEITKELNAKTNVTSLKSKTTSNFSEKDFSKLAQLVTKIRNNYTK